MDSHTLPLQMSVWCVVRALLLDFCTVVLGLCDPMSGALYLCFLELLMDSYTCAIFNNL